MANEEQPAGQQRPNEQRIADLENWRQEMTKHYWRFQGRLNALELVARGAVLDHAKLFQNPFQWIQLYVETMRQSLSTLWADVDDQSKVEQLRAEMKNSADEFLESLLLQAGQLKGAPGNPL